MSFMFNPYPYHDPSAVNRLDAKGLDMDAAVCGNTAVVQNLLSGDLERRVIGVDGYATAPFELLENLVVQQCTLQKVPVVVLRTQDLFRDADELNCWLRENYLPENREEDPVLLYGKLFRGDYEELFDREKLAAACHRLREFRKTGAGVLLVIGAGSLCGTLRALCDLRVFAEVPPMRAILNAKSGSYRNIGAKAALPYKLLARRCYYVDFEAALKLRLELLRTGELDRYILAGEPDRMTLLPLTLLRGIFRKAVSYPLRTRPVYLEGVWGGYYIQRMRHLPKEMVNCAWVFDFIPMEVSLVLELAGKQLEFPFCTLVQAESDSLMGKESVARFGPYFPVRFNYDDTWHSNGNMSIQCHPGEDYVKTQNDELGRQDESYYIVEATQGAKTYLGFNEGVDVEEFISETKRSERDGKPIDYKKYIQAVESKPGMQVMIPAGTIHASGRNQLILEIGSLTVGSYTYKMYDYLRKDFDGNPRPIHTYHGGRVLDRSRKGRWITDNLVQPPRVAAKGADWEELIVGEHELLYFSLRNLRFSDRIDQDTRGSFHVLALVDGEQALIRSKADPTRCFLQNYLEIVVIPADFGPYEIINQKAGTTIVIHKTLLKE